MTIRAKLTLINAGVIAILTSLLGIVIFVVLSADLHQAVDRELAARANAAQRLFTEGEPNGDGPGSESLDPAELSLRQPRIFDDTDLNDPNLKVWDKDSLVHVRQTGEPVVTTVTLPANGSLPEEAIRVMTVRVQAPARAFSCLQIAASLASVENEVRILALHLAIIIPFSWLAALVAGWFLTNSALGPVRRLAQDSQALLKGNPSLRLPDMEPDEMGDLARVINQGLDRIETGYRRVERFAGDASHELKSPLTAILLRASSAPPDNPQAMAANLEAIRKSARGMTSMVNDLLLAAKLEEGGASGGQVMNVLDVIQSALDSIGHAENSKVSIRSDPNIVARGEKALVERAIGNLVLNSLQHGGAGARVWISAKVLGSTVEIIVEDSGPGIAEEDQPFIFERFYRGDTARTHDESWEGEGSGLGLAITHAIVERLGGAITCESRLGHGTKMTISLPSA